MSEELTEMFGNQIPDLPKATNIIVVDAKFDYLDKGYVEFLGNYGSDGSVVEAARASFGEGAYEDPKKNQGLINYMMEHKHMSPFEIPVVHFRVRVPLFVRAQLVRHRTQSCNWESHRYKEAALEAYVPSLNRFRQQGKWNKQGSGEPLPEEEAERLRDLYAEEVECQAKSYQALLDAGVSRETARGVLSSSIYSTGVLTMKLRNMFHFLKLRTDSHAQPEIRLLAAIMEKVVAMRFPMSHKAWNRFDNGSVTFSRDEMERMRSTEEFQYLPHLFDEEEPDGSTRRHRDFMRKLEPEYIPLVDQG